MMAVPWDDIERDLSWSRHHFGKAVALFPDVMPDTADEPDYMRAMAFMPAMQSGYTSFESAMKRPLSMLDEPVPTGGGWHKDLVQRLAAEVFLARLGPALDAFKAAVDPDQRSPDGS